MMIPWNKKTTLLLLGDLITALIVTMIGFMSHYGQVDGWRWLTTYLPVVAGWLAIAPWLGVYQAQASRRALDAWRAGLAAVLSAPLAAWLRGALLNSPIPPVFVLVLGLTNALGFILWRAMAAFVIGKITRKR